MNETTTNKQVVEYFDLLQVVFAFYFEKTTMDMGVEDLHKLRVEIKKQRAFFRLLEELPGAVFTKSEHFKTLASIFKPGGRLRETHVNQQLLNRYRSYSLNAFRQFLSKKDKKQTKKFAKALRQFDLVEFKELNKEVGVILDAIDFDVVREKSLAFVNSELDAIKLLRPKIQSDKDLHQMRTHTKALGYITKFLNELSPSKQLSDLLLISKPTEKLIGNWHDRLVLRNSLVNYLQVNPDAPDENEAKKLISQLNRRNQLAVKIIASRLDGILSVDVTL